MKKGSSKDDGRTLKKEAGIHKRIDAFTFEK